MPTNKKQVLEKPKKGIYQSRTLPKNHQYQVVSLVLQGGGALGSYQAGVYQGLAEADLHPNWVAGISIGALNTAIIAGNPPGKRVERLLEFWETICQPPFLPASTMFALGGDQNINPQWQSWFNSWESWRSMAEGQKGFFLPRPFGMNQEHQSPDTVSFYDTTPLKSTLEKLVDFDRINDSHEMRVSIGAVNIATGNFIYFDNTQRKLRPEHFIASGSLPPGFPATEIDGEYYWDGGVVSNTPLSEVLTAEPRKNSLVFQVDLWSSKGKLPSNIAETLLRQKDIQYASRTRMITSYMTTIQKHRHLLHELLKLVPEEALHDNHWVDQAKKLSCDRLFNVIHLIYQQKNREGYYKDCQFGSQVMQEHWKSGLNDIQKTLKNPNWLDMPEKTHPFITHDIHRK